METLEQTHPSEDEDKTHGCGSENAPKKHPVLVLSWDLEVGENQNEDKNIVDTQAQLNQVSGKLLGG